VYGHSLIMSGQAVLNLQKTSIRQLKLSSCSRSDMIWMMCRKTSHSRSISVMSLDSRVTVVSLVYQVSLATVA